MSSIIVSIDDGEGRYRYTVVDAEDLLWLIERMALMVRERDE